VDNDKANPRKATCFVKNKPGLSRVVHQPYVVTALFLLFYKIQNIIRSGHPAITEFYIKDRGFLHKWRISVRCSILDEDRKITKATCISY
jgi:hypothetical protein